MTRHRRASNWWRRFGAALALLMAAACAGPAAAPGAVSQSATGTAVVKGGPADEVYILGRGAVTVTRIGDTSLVDGNGRLLYRTVEVYAGFHDIHFTYRYASLCAATVESCAITFSRPGRLALNALPGHVYRVTATYSKGGMRAWIIDESNAGQVVAVNSGEGVDWAASQQGISSAHKF